MHTCFSEYSVCSSLIYLLDQVYRSFIHAGITLHVDIKPLKFAVLFSNRFVRFVIEESDELI